MRILLTNDDGINAPGLEVLEDIASQLTTADNIWVVAPETDQSGLAHSFTLLEPLRLRKLSTQKFALKGTPTDCVIMGVTEIMEEKPDLVLSGVNAGQNIGDDITYSGTVAGAMEGTILGVRSIAISQAYDFSGDMHNIRWNTARTLSAGLVEKLCQVDFAPKTLININFPNCEADAVEGVDVTRQGTFTSGLSMEKRHDGRGVPYYWLRFGRGIPEQPEGSDVTALSKNRVSITPLKLDLTNEPFAEQLGKLFGA